MPAIVRSSQKERLHWDRTMRISISRFFVCFLALALAAPAFARSPELTTQGLEQRIDFWKKVYTQYGKEDVIIHDRTHVNLIYDVASDDDVNAKLSAVRGALSEIRANLDTPDSLSPAAHDIYTAISGQGIPLVTASIDELSA